MNIEQILQNNGIKSIISDYYISETSPIVGINIGCQLHKYSKTLKEKSAIIYKCKIENIHYIYDIILAIAIEIQGIENVSLTTIIFTSYHHEITINGNTYKQFIKDGIIPEKYLKNKQSHQLFNKNQNINKKDKDIIIIAFIN